MSSPAIALVETLRPSRNTAAVTEPLVALAKIPPRLLATKMDNAITIIATRHTAEMTSTSDTKSSMRLRALANRFTEGYLI